MLYRFCSICIKLITTALNGLCRITGADVSTIIINRTESFANLPGNGRFIPTRLTETRQVRELIKKLRPVTCTRELIRFGPDTDGGYLLPNDLAGIEACFSPGVNNVSGFELDCANKGMKVFMADASVEGPAAQHPQFHFVKKFIGASTQAEFITLDDWVATSIGSSKSDLLLQMDIEGYEYDALLSASSALLQRVRVMVIEFHDLEYLFCGPAFPVYKQVFEKILQTHTCVHIHPNNYSEIMSVDGLEVPQMAEFTFLRNDRVHQPSFARQFPHPLDKDNTSKPSRPLPKSFYDPQPN